MNAPAAPKVSFVTVNRNQAAGLAKTLDSVRAQTFRDFEHVVIDGASTDGSVDEIRARADGLAHWVSEPDGGVYEAMNKGIRAARGEYVHFLNSGDWLADRCVLERAFGPAGPDADLLYGNVLRPTPEGGVREVRYPDELTMACFAIRQGICHQAIFYKRELFAVLGAYDESLRIMADWDFTLRAVVAGRSCRHLPFPVAFYDAGGLSALDPERLAREKEIVLRRHLPAAVLRDYERLKLLEEECRRLRKNAREWEAIRNRSVAFQLVQIAKGSAEKWRRRFRAWRGNE